MKYYSSFLVSVGYLLLFSAVMLICACENGSDKSGSSAVQTSDSTNANVDTSTVKAPVFSADYMEVKTFEVKDSTGKSQGWGYDIYIENKKTIHQPIIPAIPGNRAFKTEADARKTGMFALGKMIKESALPTLLIKELDSLGVIK